MHGLWEDLEGVGHDQIAKAIEDHVDLHPLRGFACQGLLKGLTNLVIFPDIGFEVHTLLGCINRCKHGIVEVTPVIVDAQAIVPHLHFVERRMGKASLPLLPVSLALLGDDLEDKDNDRLQEHHQAGQCQQDSYDGVPAWLA
jgi:hypothetical protein